MIPDTAKIDSVAPQSSRAERGDAESLSKSWVPVGRLRTALQHGNHTVRNRLGSPDGTAASAVWFYLVAVDIRRLGACRYIRPAVRHCVGNPRNQGEVGVTDHPLNIMMHRMYVGVFCGGCGRFTPVHSYESNQARHFASDVDIGEDPIRCRHCGDFRPYLAPAVAHSLSPDGREPQYPNRLKSTPEA